MKSHRFASSLVLASIIFAFYSSSTARALHASSNDDEISLFDSSGQPVAYVADDDLTVYLWSGKPVAYLESDDNEGGFHIYGFNGKHLGWFVGGVVRDHQGHAVGAIKERFSTATRFEPVKGFKQFKPFKYFKAFAPFRPFFVNVWSDTPLKLFLLQGVTGD
jgi:hypothetical protein